MGRRTVLLIVAAVIAVLGSAMVILYVHGADNRAQEKQQPVTVLKAKSQIDPGETVAQAMQAGKIVSSEVPQSQILIGAMQDMSSLNNEVALTTIYPGEQIVSSKFGSPGDQQLLNIPDKDIAISVSLSDTGRVSGFVSPGSNVAIFVNIDDKVQLLMEKVQVIAVGDTTITNTTTTDQSGQSTTEQLPKTLFTLAVTQPEAQKILLAAATGDLAYGLLTDKSVVHKSPATTLGNLFVG
jgi:pilus assembly protein CpaB